MLHPKSPPTGQYFDGTNAGFISVDLTIGADGLRLRGAEREIFWPRREWVLVSVIGAARAPHSFRLSVKSDPDARLVVDGTHFAEFAAADPKLFDPDRGTRRMAGLVLGLVGASAALLAVLFFGIPAASGPLARATSRDLEAQMGRNMTSQINLIMRPCKDQDEALALLAPALNRLATAGEVGFPIEFRFVSVGVPNAFALPGGQVMATSGLLDAVGDQDQFFAVIAHELNHVKRRHGMQAFYRNLGLGLGLELVTGGSGVAQQGVTLAAQVTQLRHTRNHEREADRDALALLAAEGLDPAALARAFEAITARAPVGDEADEGVRLTLPGKVRVRIPDWLRSHPDLDERISAARALAKPARTRLLSDADWATVKSACANG